MKMKSGLFIRSIFTSIIILILPAAFAAADMDADRADLEKLHVTAIRVIRNMKNPYREAVFQVSPARLPDEVDYLLHKPLDIDISFTLDSFKQRYCQAIPSDFKIEIVDIVPVEVRKYYKTINKYGVMIDSPELKNAVKSVADDFESARGKNLYNYSVNVTRKAVVKVEVRMEPFDCYPEGFPSDCRHSSKSWFKLWFYEHDGKWLLYDIMRSDLIVCKRKREHRYEMPGREPTPYYENCK